MVDGGDGSQNTCLPLTVVSAGRACGAAAIRKNNIALLRLRYQEARRLVVVVVVVVMSKCRMCAMIVVQVALMTGPVDQPLSSQPAQILSSQQRKVL